MEPTSNISSFSLLLLLLVLSVSHITQQLHSSLTNVCPNCGNIDIPYPLTTNDKRGNPKYNIHCNKTTLGLHFISADGFFYQIISIDPEANRLVIRPPVIEKHTYQSSDLHVGGFKLDDDSPFNISSCNSVLLLNCSENILLSPLNCSSSSICRRFEEEENVCEGMLCCSYLKDASKTNHRIRVRVGGCTAYTSVVDINSRASVDSWNFGVELQWVSPF